MWTDEQFEQLEQDERTLTEEAIVSLLLALSTSRMNLEKELRSFYQKYGQDGVVTWREVRKWVSNEDHRKRLTVLLLILTDEFDRLHYKLNLEFNDFLKDVVKKEFSFFDVDLNIEDILDTPWGVDDVIWSSRLVDDIELWKVYVANDLKQAFLRQDDVEKVINRLNKRFTTMENVIQKLAMTESTAVGSLARREIFKELGITKYKYYAREDERTCDVCGSLHGLIFPISSYEVGVTASPMHPWCRCWEVPIRD